MRYVLLTGVTGLLGRYLLKDLLLAGMQVAVVARSSRRASARSRVDAAVLYWEQQLGQKFPRPVVLEGDITEPDLGFEPRAVRWVAEHCDTLLHNAASLTFQSTGRDAEPWRSNVDGMQNVLDLCRATGIRHFHHVSTAYVCGQRSGVIRESELDEGQAFSNDYEQSKVEAEKLVRNCGLFDSLTVFRPAIIIGDSVTGYTTTYHGFYAPVQACYTLISHLQKDHTGWTPTSARFSLSGNETKNLVPVEWVSAVMAHIVTHPEHHGQTYHLTPRHAVTMRAIGDVLEQSVKFYPVQWMGPGVEFSNPTDHELLFQQMITVYRSYWRDDPQFDTTNTQRAAPHLPCPRITRKVLRHLAEWAIQNNFDSPKGRQPVPEFDALSLLEPLIDKLPQNGHVGNSVNLQVRGHGGGQWQLIHDGERLVAADDGFDAEAAGTIDIEVDVLADLAEGRLSALEALEAGQITVSGGVEPDEAAAILGDLTQTGSLQPR